MTNSLGIKMILIEPGNFNMGCDTYKEDQRSHWEETPVHKVTISKPFYISETEITIEQFRQFKPDFKGTESQAPYAAGLSWYDSIAFCEWLSKKEGKPYRLPTEAEWEYACRAGTTTLYYTGNEPPENRNPNPWGLLNMNSGPREWCLDWFCEYVPDDQTDPFGAEFGIGKIVRGGPLDDLTKTATRKLFNTSSTRSSIAPSFGIKAPVNKTEQAEEKTQGSTDVKKNKPGFHNIGFRVVQGPMPSTKPLSYEVPFAHQGVKDTEKISRTGPAENKPYFRKRYLLSTPPDNCSDQENDAVGMHPSFRNHNHSPGLEVFANGDVLM
ncbi:MAG: hypothetical protein E4H40_06240, partial [Candidatus Brocadiia bacterium]